MKLSNHILVYLLGGPKKRSELEELVSDFIDPASAVRKIVSSRCKPGEDDQLNALRGKKMVLTLCLNNLFKGGWIEDGDNGIQLAAGAVERLRATPSKLKTKRGCSKSASVMSAVKTLWEQGRIDISVTVRKDGQG
jgi:hypothetical protein